MGAKSMDYRPEFTWMSIEDIESGKSREWNNLSSLNPSLNLAIKEFSVVFKSNYMEKYKKRFQTSPEMIKKFFKIYVGYHPAYGLYLMSIGPYMGKKEELNENKFGYFTQRLASTDSDSLRSLLSGFVNNRNNVYPQVERDLGLSSSNRKRISLPEGVTYQDDEKPDIPGTSVLSKQRDDSGNWTGEFKREGIWTVLDETDFQLVIKHRTGFKNDKTTGKGMAGDRWGRTIYEVIDINQDYLKQNDYEESVKNTLNSGQDISSLRHSTVAGTGSEWKLKPSGVFKLIVAFSGQPGQAEHIAMVGSRLAKKYNIPTSDISKYLRSDENFAEDFISLYGVLSGNQYLSGITKSKVFGSQATSALQTSEDVNHHLKLEMEVLSAIITLESDDAKIVTRFINQKRVSMLNKLQQLEFKPIDENFIAYIIDDIKDSSLVKDNLGNIVGQKSYKELLPEFESDLQEVIQSRGFYDLETTMKIASLYVGSAIQNELPFEEQYQNKMVDPVTKAKLIKIPEIFDSKTLDRNFTSSDLEEIQQGTFSEEQEGDADDFDIDEIEDITEENKGDYLTEEEQKLLGFDVIDKTPEVAEEEMVDVSIPSVKTLPDLSDQEKEEKKEKEGQKDTTVSRTLNSLIKIAKDLRFQGKNRSAIGVEMIIKKYQGK